jgi:hypothetical protein
MTRSAAGSEPAGGLLAYAAAAGAGGDDDLAVKVLIGVMMVS